MSQEETSHRNIMPSEVLRQQQQLLAKIRSGAGRSTNSITSNHANNNNNINNNNALSSFRNQNPSKSQTAFAMPKSHTSLAYVELEPEPGDRSETILPKRIPQVAINPGQQPIIRDLNREFKFNQIRGKNVLDQKSELKKALERLADTKRRKEAEQERLSRRTSLEMRLEERAQKISKETGG